MKRITGIMAAVFLCGLVMAQASKPPARSVAEIRIEKHRLALEAEPVAAEDGPARTAVGATWSPGAGPAVLSLEAPLRVEKALVAPGRYRVRLARIADASWALRVENAPKSLGSGPVGGDLDLPLTKSAATPPAAKLDAKWALNKPEKDGGFGLTLTIRIGDDAFLLRGVSWAGEERATLGWTAHAWPLPADFATELNGGGTPVPFITFRHADAADPKRVRVYNVLVLGDTIAVAEASEGPAADGVTPITQAPKMYPAVAKWMPSKNKTPLIGAPSIDIRARQGIYMKLSDGARSVTFSVLEPDYGQKK